MNDSPEEWRKVPDFPSYSISSLGRVRRDITARSSNAGRILTPQIRDGYLSVRLRRNGETKNLYIHRILATAFIGPPPSPLHQVAHGDGNRTNCDLSNLRWATAAENCVDRLNHGTQYQGERHYSAKVNPAIVLEIRQRRGEGVDFERMSLEYGVTKDLIGKICRRKIWKHVA